MTRKCTHCNAKMIPGKQGYMTCSNPECPGEKSEEAVDLSLASTQGMVDELRRRSEVFVMGLRPLVKQGKEYDWIRCVGGEVDRVLGLVELIKFDVMNQFIGDDEDEGDDE